MTQPTQKIAMASRQYGSDGYSLRGFGRMLNDKQRTDPYIEAIRRYVTPTTVFFDIGTGPGALALLAAHLGAARVYAIEPDNSIEVAKLCAAGAPGADRITWIQGLSTEIELPEKADLIVGDLHGTMPFYNGNIPSLVDARHRHLAPGGRILPARDILRAVPANAPKEYDLDEPWGKNRFGIDLSAGRPFVANSWWRAEADTVDKARFLSDVATWGTIDYMTVDTSNVDGTMHWHIESEDTMHGYYVWFDGEIADGLGFSNTPLSPELVYGRGFFPLEKPVHVVPGDEVSTRMSVKLMGEEHTYRWDTRITGADGTVKASFRQSTFRSKPISLERLRQLAPDHVATLSANGQIDEFVLHSILQAMSLGAVAKALVARFPKVFADETTALARVTKLVLKYSEA